MDESHNYVPEERHLQVEDMLIESDAPLRQRRCKQLDRSGPWGEVETRLKTALGTGFLIGLIGGRGSGKTQLGVEAIRENAQRLRSSRYCTVTGFFVAIKAGYKADGESEAAIMETFAAPRLLVIDEVARRSETDWENRLLFELINQRYNAMKDTLVISAQAVEQLQASLGDSLASRMQETGCIIECKWPSFREAK